MSRVLNPSDWVQKLTIPEYKIYDLMPDGDYDRTILPIDIDFKTGLAENLYKEVTMEGGAPVRKIYYTEAELQENGSVTYTNPIVKIEYIFERDSISLAKSWTQKFYWMTTDNDWSNEYKEIGDRYTYAESMWEAKLRRTNIIDDLKVKTIGLIMYTEQVSQADAAELGRPFLAVYKSEIINYIDEANMDFYDRVVNASSETYPWLDNITPYTITIREFILNALA